MVGCDRNQGSFRVPRLDWANPLDPVGGSSGGRSRFPFHLSRSDPKPRLLFDPPDPHSPKRLRPGLASAGRNLPSASGSSGAEARSVPGRRSVRRAEALLASAFRGPIGSRGSSSRLPIRARRSDRDPVWLPSGRSLPSASSSFGPKPVPFRFGGRSGQPKPSLRPPFEVRSGTEAPLLASRSAFRRSDRVPVWLPPGRNLPSASGSFGAEALSVRFGIRSGQPKPSLRPPFEVRFRAGAPPLASRSALA